MVSIKIPAILRDVAGGRSVIRVEVADAGGITLADVFSRLATDHVGVRDRTLTEQGAIRPHVNIFVNSISVKDAEGLATQINDDDEIQIIAAVSGG